MWPTMPPMARMAWPWRCEGLHDILIVDRMLPKLDGLSIIRTLRAKGITTPVLILSALSDVDERVKGLRAGGDDYLGETLCLLRTAGPRRRPRPPQFPGAAGNQAEGRRS